MNDLLLHPRTQKELNLFLTDPSHALLITGRPGSGKKKLATYIAAKTIHLDDLQNYPYLLTIKRPEKKQEIPIDEIRRVRKFLSLRTPGTKTIKKAVIVEDAQFLNNESSNALLKILEEPPADTLVILTALTEQNLLPTISSRVQHIEMLPIGLAEAISELQGNFSKSDIETYWRLSQGASELLLALLDKTDEHPVKLAVEAAKKYLKKDKYQRILEVEQLTKDKARLMSLLDGLSLSLGALQYSAATRANLSQQRLILKSRKLVKDLTLKLDNNANTRLVTMELALKLL